MSVIAATRGLRDLERPAFGRANGGLRASQSKPLPAVDGGDSPLIEGRADAQAETTVYLSPAAKRLLDPGSSDPSTSAEAGDSQLTKAELQQVVALKARDTEVRVHEAAHAASAGGLGGRPSLEYATGPDGRRYAVSGEVSIDMSPGRTPQETVTRARTIRAAATAPASPSAQDMAVASAAARMEAEAQREILQAHQAEVEGRSEARTVGAPQADRSSSDEASPASQASPASHDPHRIINQLIRERAQTLGDRGHVHTATGCGFCQGAARAYA
jgi:hypothetical protein